MEFYGTFPKLLNGNKRKQSLPKFGLKRIKFNGHKDEVAFIEIDDYMHDIEIRKYSPFEIEKAQPEN